MRPMEHLDNKNIWIIGASSGIGKAVAEHLVKKGATVAVSARSEDDLNQMVKDFGDGNHLSLPMDVTEIEAFDKAIEQLNEKWGRLDSVLYFPAMYDFHSSKRKELSFIHKAIDVNIKGAMTAVENTFPIFKAQGYGQMVLCGSVAGYRGLPNGQPYCATKAAIINYTESLKVEMEAHNIDVKLICPGFVKTRLTEKNDFPMPFIIEAKEAAARIATGMTDHAFEIHFPKKLTYLMKILQLLPNPIYFLAARQMAGKIND